MSAERSNEAGFVLPSVVAVLVVIAAAAALATQQLQTHTRITAARLDRLRLQGVVDGTARFVALSSSTSGPDACPASPCRRTAAPSPARCPAAA